MNLKDLDSLVGMPKDEAQKFLTDNSIEYRVLKIDDEGFFGTADYKMMRVNLVIKNGLVESYSFG